jgi:hypothetical protein
MQLSVSEGSEDGILTTRTTYRLNSLVHSFISWSPKRQVDDRWSPTVGGVLIQDKVQTSDTAVESKSGSEINVRITEDVHIRSRSGAADDQIIVRQSTCKNLLSMHLPFVVENLDSKDVSLFRNTVFCSSDGASASSSVSSYTTHISDLSRSTHATWVPCPLPSFQLCDST